LRVKAIAAQPDFARFLYLFHKRGPGRCGFFFSTTFRTGRFQSALGKAYGASRGKGVLLVHRAPGDAPRNAAILFLGPHLHLAQKPSYVIMIIVEPWQGLENGDLVGRQFV
jgi:hypothetical protein